MHKSTISQSRKVCTQINNEFTKTRKCFLKALPYSVSLQPAWIKEAHLQLFSHSFKTLQYTMQIRDFRFLKKFRVKFRNRPEIRIKRASFCTMWQSFGEGRISPSIEKNHRRNFLDFSRQKAIRLGVHWMGVNIMAKI